MTAVSDFGSSHGAGFFPGPRDLHHPPPPSPPGISKTQEDMSLLPQRGRSPPSPSPSPFPPSSPPSSPPLQHRNPYDASTPPSITPPKPYLPLRTQASQTLRSQQQPPWPPSPLHDIDSPTDENASPTRQPTGGLPRRPSTPRLLRDAQFDELPKELPRADSVALPAGLPGPTGRMRGQTTSQLPPPTRAPDWPLKGASSIPDLRASQTTTPRSVSSSIYRPDRGPYARESSHSSLRREHGHRRQSSFDELRTSYRSIRTTSSTFMDASVTERSSVATKDTSLSDITQPTSIPDDDTEDEGMSVEDAISMYAQGFTDDPQRNTFIESSSDSGYGSQFVSTADEEEVPRSPSSPSEAKTLSPISDSTPEPQLLKDEPDAPKPPAEAESDRSLPPVPNPQPKPQTNLPGRDRYGFKKATQLISESDYNTWNVRYEEHLGRRYKKWEVLMKQHGLSTDNPVRFPGRSDKVKRYIRKGIPPEWRGAAWFWYAGGPVRLAQRPGLYPELLQRADDGGLSEHDREQMERDLNRTFPDNVQFRPETATGDPEFDPETPIVGALRRVLKAFAVHNPSIGYCQSLNFLAGLLLLFLDSDEEKAFIMLSILCNDYLPGAHGRVLEASVEVGVLMSCIRETMPAIWEKIDDQPQADIRSPPGGLARLPTVSLATTAWFMSCFVGNLPIESVLRVWDCLFYEGSKTLFRIALTIFKLGETQIRAVNENLEIFQVVQQIPRNLVDPNTLMEACYRRRNGFGHLSQESIDAKRKERRAMVKDGTVALLGGGSVGGGEIKKPGTLRRAASKARLKGSTTRKRT